MSELSKKCNACGETKPLTEFHRHKGKKYNRRSHCKACHGKRTRAYAKANPEKEQGYRKKYRSSAAVRERENQYQKDWSRRNPERIAELRAQKAKVQRERHPEKAKARKVVLNAVARGRIKKPERCERCGGQFARRELQGHHHDYSKPLDVEWLCSRCHADVHLEARGVI